MRLLDTHNSPICIGCPQHRISVQVCREQITYHATVCLSNSEGDKDLLQYVTVRQGCSRRGKETMKHGHRLSAAAWTVRDGLSTEPFWLRSWIPDTDWWTSYTEGDVPRRFHGLATVWSSQTEVNKSMTTADRCDQGVIVVFTANYAERSGCVVPTVLYVFGGQSNAKWSSL